MKHKTKAFRQTQPAARIADAGRWSSKMRRDEIRIRTAEEADMAPFTKICMDTWGGIDAQKISSYFNKGIAIFKNGYCVASVKNKIVGIGEGFPIHRKLEIPQMNLIDDPIDLYTPNGHYYYIHGIEVLSKYQKRGLGRLLLTYYLNAAATSNCIEICGIAISKNIGFWLKQGFSINGKWYHYKRFGRFAWVSMKLETHQDRIPHH